MVCVMQITTATVQSGAEQRSRQAAEQERLRSFPSLGGATPPMATAEGAPLPAPSPTQRMPSHAAASRDQNYEAAFSEEDSPRGESQQPTAASEAIQAGAEDVPPSTIIEEAEGRTEEGALGEVSRLQNVYIDFLRVHVEDSLAIRFGES